MTYDIVLAGVGGQGVLSLAAILARAAMIDGLRVRQSEVHGMAQRGGAVSAHLRISDADIASDLVSSGGADMILAMEPLESLRYLSFLKPEGIVVTAAESFVNIPDYPDAEKLLGAVRSLPRSRVVDASAIAKEAGSPRAVNMALAGAASLLVPIKLESLERGMDELFGGKGAAAAAANRRAFELARERGAGERDSAAAPGTAGKAPR
jgi:indolepyruvate ferredoxin oxidoreductase, beta subunit